MQRYRLPLVTIAGLLALVLIGVFASNGSPQTRAEEGPPLMQMPDFPPTPTISAAPPQRQLAGANVLFSDDFSSGALTNWQLVDLKEVIPGEESVWRVADGVLLQDRTARAYNPDFRDTMAVTGDPAWTDYTVSAKIYDAANATFGLVARVDGTSFYRFRMFYNDTEGEHKLVLEKVVDGEVTELASSTGPGYEHYRWYSLSLRVNGTSIQASVDGNPVLEATDATLTHGQAGVTTIAFGAVSFDNVTVTAP